MAYHLEDQVELESDHFDKLLSQIQSSQDSLISLFQRSLASEKEEQIKLLQYKTFLKWVKTKH